MYDFVNKCNELTFISVTFIESGLYSSVFKKSAEVHFCAHELRKEAGLGF